MRVTFLGTGTSHGVPVIACECSVCQSKDPRNHRTRTSCWVEIDGLSLVIDTGPEFRLQALANGLRWVDAVLFTHSHADHIFGLDDIRRFNWLRGGAIPCYGLAETLKDIRRVYQYVFEETQVGGGKPMIELIPINGDFEVRGVLIKPLLVYHGRLPVLGYRLRNFAWVTDVNYIPPETLARLKGVEILVLGALRPKPHPTHFSIPEAVAMAQKIGARQTYLVHMTHDVDHETTNRSLPPEVQLAYDGLQLDLS